MFGLSGVASSAHEQASATYPAEASNPRLARCESSPPSEPPKQTTAGHPTRGASPAGVASRPWRPSTSTSTIGAPATRATVRRTVRPAAEASTVTSHGSGGTNSAGTCGDENRMAHSGAAASARVQSPPVESSWRGSSAPVSSGPPKRASARHCAPSRSVAPVRTSTSPVAPPTVTTNGSSWRLRSGTPRRSTASVTSGSGGVAVETGESPSSRAETAADRFSNQGGKTPETRPARPITVYGTTQ